MSTKNRTLAKSLHTVTAIADVARLHMQAHALPPAAAILRALDTLGYAGAADPYSLAAKALAKIEGEELAKFPADDMAEEVRATVILAYSLPASWDKTEQTKHIAATIREAHGPHFWVQLVRSEAEIYGTAEPQPGDVFPIEHEERAA
jgi:hypothetical protein